MSDPQSTPPATGMTVPADTQAKFGELIALIKASESMNDEERQYWINLLPVMTPEQVANLNEILINERTQLAAIDEKYGKDAQSPAPQSLQKMEEDRKKKKAQRTSAEESDKQKEAQSAEDVLKQIEG
jgi:hypothetical protein